MGPQEGSSACAAGARQSATPALPPPPNPRTPRPAAAPARASPTEPRQPTAPQEDNASQTFVRELTHLELASADEGLALLRAAYTVRTAACPDPGRAHLVVTLTSATTRPGGLPMIGARGVSADPGICNPSAWRHDRTLRVRGQPGRWSGAVVLSRSRALPVGGGTQHLRRVYCACAYACAGRLNLVDLADAVPSNTGFGQLAKVRATRTGAQGCLCTGRRAGRSVHSVCVHVYVCERVRVRVCAAAGCAHGGQVARGVGQGAAHDHPGHVAR
jgi:hypothetical protein